MKVFYALYRKVVPMNSYHYDEINIGDSASFSVTITSSMMDQFLSITDDQNPLHCDDGYAQQNGYPGRVVYGMLTSSFYSTLAGVYLPGERSLLQSVETKMLLPVFVGDTLTVTGKVHEKHDLFQLLILKSAITNQKGEKVSKATIQVGVRK